MRRLLLALMLVAGTADAATYWVSPTGSAAASGADSLANAKTLANVNAIVVAGDIVRFKTGTYTSPIQPNANGTSGNRIRYYGFQSAPGAVTVTDIRFGWNGSNSRGDYSTAIGVTVSGRMTGCDEVAALRATGDSIAYCNIPNSAGGFNYRTSLSVIDNCTFGGGSVTGTGQSHYIDMFNANNIYASGNRITNCTFAITVNTAPPQGDVHILGMARTYGNVVYGNTFNITVTNVGGTGVGYFFPVEMYRSYYNSFQSNTFNLTMNATPNGTHSIWAQRDSSSFNRFVNNTVTTTGSGAIGVSWNNSGSFPGTTQGNYMGGNVFKLSNPDGGGVFYSQNGCRGDTIEFNRFITSDTDPAMAMGAVPITNTVFRHNTGYTTGATVVSMGSATSASGSKFVSNIAYTTAANGSSPVVSVPTGMGMDSLGVIFSRGGTSSNAIRYGGVNGPPGSGTTGYGLAGKALWNTPLFNDSTYATADLTLRGGSPATTATLQDGYAGALGTASADVTAPSAISDLAAGTATPTTIPLTWTSQGDDAGVGTATSYELRYSTGVINAGNFSSATLFTTGVPVPLVAGTSQGVTVTGLTPGTSYQFAIKSKDEANNTSAISNVPGQSTAAAVDVTPPGAVQDLSANGQSQTSVALIWTAPGDDGLLSGTATTYDVRRNTTDITAANWSSSTQLTNETAPKSPGNLELLVDDGLSPGTVYYYAVRTRDEEGNESGLSNVAAGETSPDLTSPSAISISAYSPSNTSAALVWGSVGDDGMSGAASSYILKRSTSTITSGNFDAATTVALDDGSGGPYRINQESGQQESFTETGLPTSTTQFYAIRACDEVPNCSPISNVVSITTGADVDVTAPADITTLASNAQTTNSIDLTWTAPGDDGSSGTATSYDVRYIAGGTINAGNFATATQAVGEPTPLAAGNLQVFTIGGLSSATTYSIAVKTTDESGNTSGISNVLSQATIGDATDPAAVSNLAVVSTGVGSVTLRWTAPGDDGNLGTAAAYDVRYTTAGALTEPGWAAATQATGEPTPSVAGSIESMTISGLTPATTYFFALKTRDEVPRESSISNSPSGVPLSATPGTARARRFRQVRR